MLSSPTSCGERGLASGCASVSQVSGVSEGLPGCPPRRERGCLAGLSPHGCGWSAEAKAGSLPHPSRLRGCPPHPCCPEAVPCFPPGPNSSCPGPATTAGRGCSWASAELSSRLRRFPLGLRFVPGGLPRLRCRGGRPSRAALNLPRPHRSRGCCSGLWLHCRPRLLPGLRSASPGSRRSRPPPPPRFKEAPVLGSWRVPKQRLCPVNPEEEESGFVRRTWLASGTTQGCDLAQPSTTTRGLYSPCRWPRASLLSDGQQPLAASQLLGHSCHSFSPTRRSSLLACGLSLSHSRDAVPKWLPGSPSRGFGMLHWVTCSSPTSYAVVLLCSSPGHSVFSHPQIQLSVFGDFPSCIAFVRNLLQ